uniref:Piscidin 2 n=1 Tax=Epinephelus coioides TaxID=94232 RepID=F1CNA7_EPICO|nr:piscidin 2 precursor [Epinephelus coioides]AEA39756.1 piscidin-like peptide [Epinephelus coioides]AFM37317.1 piscidin-like peptide [Epinephelus coioides]
MRCIALFLVLSLVVLMAEPGEGFFFHIVKGLFHAGRMIHGLVNRRRHRHGMEELDLDQRAFEREKAFA